MTNTNKLKAKMFEKGLNQEKIADILDISLASVNYKVNNKRPFSSDEMFILCDVLEIENPKDYFFAQDVEKNSTN